MAKRASNLPASSKKNRQTTPLGLEQLETRMMNAVGGIEQQLQLLLGPSLGGSTQMVSSMTTNSAPKVSSPAKLLSPGTEVKGTTANVSVRGADDAGESSLTYTWEATSVPQGATVLFASNGNNDSKANTLTFNKAGAYTVAVTIRDANGLTATSTLRFNVVQTLTSLNLVTADRATIDPNLGLSTTGTSQQVRAQGFDQFGAPMTTLPTLTWSRLSASNGGTISATTSNGVSTIAFSKAGTFVVQAKFGGVLTSYTANVIPTLTSIIVKNAENRLVANSGVTVNGTTQNWTATGLDQFNTPLAVQPGIAWSVATKPIGSSPTLATNGNTTNVTFDRAGNYQFLAQSGSTSFRFSVAVNAVLSTFRLYTPNGQLVDPTVPVTTSGTSTQLTLRGFDQFNQQINSLPELTWSTPKVPRGGSASSTLSNGVATINFTRAGDYTLRIRAVKADLSFQITVLQTLTSIVGLNSKNQLLATGSPVSVSSTDVTLNARGLDQFGQTLLSQPTNFAWSVVSTPSNGSATLTTGETGANVAFNRAGNYVVRVTSGSVSLTVNLSVIQKLTSASLTAANASIEAGLTSQFTARGFDQFSQPITATLPWVWTPKGGTITSSGLFTAGSKEGEFSVTIKTGTISASATITVTKAAPENRLNSSLKDLIQSLYVDNSISRNEMIQILRSVGTDGSVSAAELEDLQFLVNGTGSFAMPTYVRELARDVVLGNVANRSYQGAALGNLAAGSSATVLNKLIDKWFLGADVPAISNPSLSYQTAVGNLFNGAPSHNDTRQGALGDCYFIATVGAIADRNADAIRNMFIDNGDGTYTIRFYAGAGFSVGSGTADYLTVNRKLPASSGGALAFSGSGLSVSSTSTTLWIALLEKAYAQWNETGKEGRDGTNTYAAIEGGWMGTVNAQVLGYQSTNYALGSTDKSVLISALNSGRAVTIGTKGNASSGLFGSHAYMVTGYNASNDTFSLHNPWGYAHALALSYSQLQANCSYFVTTDPSGSTPINVTPVRFSVTDNLVGNWTTIKTIGESTATPSATAENLSQTDPMQLIDSLDNEIENVSSEWITLADDSSSMDDAAESQVAMDLNALAVDLALSGDDLDSILGIGAI